MKKQVNQMTNTERVISAVGTVIILIAAVFLKMNIPLLIVGFAIVLFARPIAHLFNNNHQKN